MQEEHNYKETSLNYGVYNYEPLLHKAKTNQMKNKQKNKLGKVGNLATSCTDWPVETDGDPHANEWKYEVTTNGN